MCTVVSLGVGDHGKGLVAAFKCAWEGFGFGVRVHVRTKATWSRKGFTTFCTSMEFDLFGAIAWWMTKFGHDHSREGLCALGRWWRC